MACCVGRADHGGFIALVTSSEVIVAQGTRVVTRRKGLPGGMWVIIVEMIVMLVVLLAATAKKGALVEVIAIIVVVVGSRRSVHWAREIWRTEFEYEVTPLIQVRAHQSPSSH